MTPPKAVLFDCDGVLVDSEGITAALLAENLTSYGFAVHSADVHRLFVGGTMAGVKTLVESRGVALPDTWLADTNAHIAKVLAAQVEVMPGVPALLDLLDAQQIAYAVVSNGPMAKMRATLGRTGLWDRLEGRIFSAHDLGVAKPSPGPYLHAASALGMATKSCVVIEDSANGLRAGVAAGIVSYGLTTDLSGNAIREIGAIPFNSMTELPGLLGLV